MAHKIYSHYGFNEFVVMCGYKGEYIKEYFLNYRANSSDITIDLSDNSVQVHKNRSEPWKITLCDTGKETLTGGRIAKIKKYIGNETFMLTYGDGVADINIPELLECHRNSGKIATLTAVRPTSRFGVLRIRKTAEYRTSAKSRKIRRRGLTAAFSFSSRKYSTIFRTRPTLYGSGSLSTTLRKQASSTHICTAASGAQWTCLKIKKT